MTKDDFIDRIIEQLESFQKSGAVTRYIRRTSEDGYTEVVVLTPNDLNKIEINIGPEVTLLTVDDFYRDDARFAYRDEDLGEVFEDIIVTLNLLVTNAYFQKLYIRGEKVLDRELFLKDSNGNPLGAPLRGKSSALSVLWRQLPGTKISVVPAHIRASG